MMRALRAEFLKLRRSRTPLWTGLVVLMCSAIGPAIYPVLSDPKTQAKLAESGGVFAKAVAAGVYDQSWPNYLRIGLQGMTGSWGIMTFGIVAAYLFGREFKEGTAKTMFTLPIRREYVVLAKMIVLAAWILVLGAVSLVLVSAITAATGTHGFAWTHIAKNATDTLGVLALLYVPLPIVAWFAMSGKGYLRPMLVALFMWLSNNSLMEGSASRWVPWAMPIHLVGASWMPVSPSPLVASSWLVAGGVLLAGLAACLWRADHIEIAG